MAILMPEKEKTITALVEAVRAVDPNVRDVVLIGSAVYAPEFARDYDLVVITASPKERKELWDGLWDGLNRDSAKGLDLILYRSGDEMSIDIARGVLCGEIIFGDGEVLAEANRAFEKGGGLLMSFKEAEAHFSEAEDALERAETTKVVELKDVRHKAAFDHLFHAARVAALTFLSRQDTSWGRLKRELPSPFGEQFREMVNTLHVFYAYDGNYPKNPQKVREEFGKWKEKVERFVGELRERTLGRNEEDGRDR